MTPAEFKPYIEAKTEAKQNEIERDNLRTGLICSVIQNGVPIGYLKKGAKAHKANDYFESHKETETPVDQTQRTFEIMNAWVEATNRR